MQQPQQKSIDLEDEEMKNMQKELLKQQLYEYQQQHGFLAQSKQYVQYMLPWTKIILICYGTIFLFQVIRFIQSGKTPKVRLFNFNFKPAQIIEGTMNFAKEAITIQNLLLVPVVFFYAFVIGIIWYQGTNALFVALGIFLLYNFF